ncbi:MAG TPA: hypothetical protein VGE74_29300 [Gemmata sp.]
MSEELLHQLRVLEAEYAGQPLVAQQMDLRTINHLRAQLGMRPVDARLNEFGAVAEKEPEPEPEPEPEHTEARAIYRAYCEKVEELEVYRAYADRVVRATGGPGQTPVRPLATMGTDGGPLLCDHCRKPIVLEGGRFHGVTADVAWQQSSGNDWQSWVLGGMVVEIQTNGTLRIYHGYPGRNPRHCCNAASRKEEQAQAKFRSKKSPELYDLILAFLAHEFPDRSEKERVGLLNDILNVLYDYDPGLGINRPGRVNGGEKVA